MQERDLTVLSRTELLDLFLEVNESLDEFCKKPGVIYRNDINYQHAEQHLLAIIIEINKRYQP